MKKDIILKTYEDKKIFIDAILNPPKANDKLKMAQINHTKFIKSKKSKIMNDSYLEIVKQAKSIFEK